MAFCIDQAVFHVGVTIRSDLDGVEGKTSQEIAQKREQVLNKYFSDEDTTAKQYADPAMLFK